MLVMLMQLKENPENISKLQKLKNQIPPHHQDNIYQALNDLYYDQDSTDFIITVKGIPLSLHKYIVKVSVPNGLPLGSSDATEEVAEIGKATSLSGLSNIIKYCYTQVMFCSFFFSWEL
eukprot:TRINITY_DN8465_c0_g1_i23.p1 TRINITY_DN8465_c0_g1~~TRINITY_DN8465_c0_g1_i23.p1  ORF type:complete len:119 (-),score=25.70 TRINITY_DN8465_c0_g1_i23:119-475(-)